MPSQEKGIKDMWQKYNAQDNLTIGTFVREAGTDAPGTVSQIGLIQGMLRVRISRDKNSLKGTTKLFPNLSEREVIWIPVNNLEVWI